MKNVSPIAYERAGISRDMEYTKQNVIDDSMQEALMCAKSKFPDAFDSSEFSDEEIDAAIDQIPTDEDQRNEEIERIVQSDKNLDIDGIMGFYTESEE